MEPAAAAEALIAEIRDLPVRNTPAIRAVRRSRSREWKDQPGRFVIGVARELAGRRTAAWVGYEIIRFHKAAFRDVDEALLEELAEGLRSWDTVDAFGTILSGPAWALEPGLDSLIDRWSRSDDLWIRRLALVSTVALSRGKDNTGKVLAICRQLVADREDMVVKALSWALRELSKADPQAVRSFLAAEDSRLAARVKREVDAKLRTGLKNPGRVTTPAAAPPRT
jgi:3-methyladenine DNA glycosylase AlkD